MTISRVLILATLAIPMLGCGLVGSLEQPDDFSDVPSGLLYECDVLAVPQATADEGVALSEGNLAALSLDTRRLLSQMVYPYQIPPVLDENTPHRGTTGLIMIRVTDLERSQRRRWGWIGPAASVVSLNASVQFVLAETEEPLSDWVDLGEFLGPAEGANLRTALRALAQQVTDYVLRDVQGL